MQSSRTPLLNRPLSPDMGEAVLEYLSKLQALPDRGYLAGQSVTSALLDLYGDRSRQGPFNDIDVFVDVNNKSQSSERYWESYFLATPGAEDMNPQADQDEVCDNYDQVFSPRQIASTMRCRKVNITHLHSMPSVDALINDFDFNMVSVGIDLEKRELRWTKSFEAFLESGEIAFNGPVRTPRSFIRALKKSSEMPWLAIDKKRMAQQAFSSWLAMLNDLYSHRSHHTLDQLLIQLDPGHTFPRVGDSWVQDELTGMHWPVSLVPAPVGARAYGDMNDHPLGLPSPRDFHAMTQACREGRVEVVMKMLEDGFPLDIPLDRGGKNALVMALCSDQLDVVRAILQKHPDTQLIGSFVKNVPLHELVVQENAAGALQFLIEKGLDPNTKTRRQNNTLAHHAAYFDSAATLKALKEAGADLEALASDGVPPLLLAAKGSRRGDSMRYLLDQGCHRGLGEKQIDHLVYESILNQATGALEAMIEHGMVKKSMWTMSRDDELVEDSTLSVVTTFSGEGLVPMVRLLKEHDLMQDHGKALHNLISGLRYSPRVDVMELLDLILDGAPPEAIHGFHATDPDKWTPLHDAAQHGSFMFMQGLLERGADFRGGPSGTPLHAAVENLERQAVLLLIHHGAQPTELMFEKLEKHHSMGSKSWIGTKMALKIPETHAMAALGMADVVIEQLDQGMSPDVKTPDGKSLAEVAEEFGYKDEANLIRTYCAKKKITNLIGAKTGKSLSFAP